MTLCADYIVQIGRDAWKCMSQAEYDSWMRVVTPTDIALAMLLILAAMVLLTLFIVSSIRRTLTERRQ